MKHKISTYALLLFLVAFLACNNKTDDKEQAVQPEINARPLTLADPFILLDQGKYYAYGTSSPDGIVCFESDDLESWKQITQNDGLALSKENTYADKWFWAPEVYKISDDEYAMVYSADEHICIAFSSDPTGPFVQKKHQPMFAEKGIDNHIFVDDDGQMYIYFDRFTNGNEIWVAKLDEDYQVDETSLVACIHAEEEWETMLGTVTEGPFVLKYNGKYIMTYSANDFHSQDYAIGYAVADTPMGPWVKSDSNPVFRRPEGLVGVGHHSLFRDKEGNGRIVFHSHYSKAEVNPRLMHISTYTITEENNQAHFSVSADYITPKVVANE